ncbi:hypothetical protein AB7C87_19330 [Natrarchaeobius sp. A-rgal3]|uniref:hypothetical protein n=1 Tax=Natrarchaeobius versutus TaxID=1679078 RepID=UPI00350FC79D
MQRRTYLTAAGTGVSALLAGCVSNFSATLNDNFDNPQTEGEPDEESYDNESENDPVDVIDAHLTAHVDQDEKRLVETVHDESPLQELFTDDEAELEEIDSAERRRTETVTRDVSTADVWTLEHAEALFEEDEISDLLDDENARLIEVEIGQSETTEEDTWFLVTEGAEWKVFWIGNQREIPDDPEEAFEDEITDDENAVVETIEYDLDLDEKDEVGSRQDYARVYFTDTPEIDADRVEVETTIGGYDGQIEGSWTDSWLLINLHSDGDQIVVTIIEDGAEEVVHREHYEP